MNVILSTVNNRTIDLQLSTRLRTKANNGFYFIKRLLLDHSIQGQELSVLQGKYLAYLNELSDIGSFIILTHMIIQKLIKSTVNNFHYFQYTQTCKVYARYCSETNKWDCTNYWFDFFSYVINFKRIWNLEVKRHEFHFILSYLQYCTWLAIFLNKLYY